MYGWVRSNAPRPTEVQVRANASQLSKSKLWTPWKIFQQQFAELEHNHDELMRRFPTLDRTSPWSTQASEAYKTLSLEERAALKTEAEARNEQIEREVPAMEQERRM